MPASRNGRRKVTWEWLVRDCMADLLEDGGSRMAFCAIRLRPALYLPKSHKCSATRASRYEGTQQRQNIFARGAEVGCESGWQDDVSVR